MSHFLIVDDDEVASAALGRLLESEGYLVTRAQSPEAALDQAVTSSPDALLLDMRMPTMTGLDFLRRLRQDARLRELPVAIITGDYFLNPRSLAEIQALGATVAYKPLWRKDLSALARSLVGTRA
jgi:CheY-like chemotaxis protein